MTVDPRLLGPESLDEVVRILHVDDNPRQTELAKTCLERVDDRFEVLPCQSADEALAKFEAARIDCIVSDYQMPEMDGLAFLETVRERDADVPFILFTGRGSEEIASKAISAGVTDYLQKRTGTDQYEVLANRIGNVVARHRNEQALARAENLFGRIFDARSEALFLVGSGDEGILAANEQVATSLGFEPGELVGDGDPDLDALGSAFRRFARETREERRRETFDCRTADGGTVPVEAIASRLPLPGRQLTVISVRDVTERRERARNLEALQAAVEHAGHSIYRTEPDGTITYVNPAFEEITGYDRAEAIGQTPAILRSGAHEDDFYRDLWETILSGEVWHSRIVNRRADGDLYVVDQTIAPVEQDGEIREFVAVNAELPDVGVAEVVSGDAPAGKTPLRSLVSPSPVAMLLAEADTGRIVAANAAAGDLFECSPADLEGRHQADLHPEGERYREVFRDHQLTARERSSGRASRATLPDGSPVEIRTASGDRRRVAIVATPTERDGTEYFLGAFVDLEAVGPGRIEQ